MEVAQISKTSWNKDVYEPSDDSFLLVDALVQHARNWRERRPLCVLEIGCGSGYVICSVALMLRHLGLSAHILATDKSPAAVAATRLTLQDHGVHNVEVVVTDLYSGLDRLVGLVDVLVFNPPYVPSPEEEVSWGGIASAWAGGHRGRTVIDRVLAKLGQLLSSGGEAFMVTVSENDPQGIIMDMHAQGFTGSIAASRQADEESLSIVHLRRQASQQTAHVESVSQSQARAAQA